jgi:cytochrome b
MKTKTFVIWDLPTRIFHWLLTAGFAAAALLAFLTDGESSLFPIHAIIGLVLALMVALRLIWGLIGTRHARFASFAFGPRAFLVYLKDAFGGGGTRHIGHNPGSAYAIFAMLALLAGICVTGIMLSRGGESFKEAHEVMTFAMIAVVAAHVLGVIFHTVRHRENITLSMVNGRKVCEPWYAIKSSRPIATAVFLGLLGLWTLGLVKNYDAAAKTTSIPFLGTSLLLGESEKDAQSEKPPGRRET